MAFEYKTLIPITTISDSAGAVFTNPASITSYVRWIQIHNANTTSETVKLYHVLNSGGAVGTAAETNKFFEKLIVANETIVFEYAAPGMMLNAENDTIQAVTDTVSKVTIEATGGQE